MLLFRKISIVLIAFLLINGCAKKNNSFDATGSFEAIETVISSEAMGVIEWFDVEEGQQLAKGQVIGYVDSTQLFLKKKQIMAQMRSIEGRRPNVSVQISALEDQLRNAKKESIRVQKLVEGNAATSKQLDDIKANVTVLESQIKAHKSTLDISNQGINLDAKQFDVQIEQIEDQLNKCVVKSPFNGTVLTKYAEVNETTAPGKALLKMADLSNIILRAYVTGDQLPKLKLNQQVSVFTDDGNGGLKETKGNIIWISDKSEFTPKTIQTKDERANMVYAIKINVVNDGALKIGMYGEVKFQNE